MKDELIIREATENDLADLAGISRLTWEGHDYLEKVSERWIHQGCFIVGDVAGRAVACAKITAMPGKVAWLEGLRVHPDFRGRGIGRLMADETLRTTLERVKAGEFESIEFSTYINNIESRSMAEKQGFRTTEFFHVLSMENPPLPRNPLTIVRSSPAEDDFSPYPEYAPCGWKYIHHSSDGSMEWMNCNAEFWQVESGARFLVSVHGEEISPLAAAFDDPYGFFQGTFALAVRKSMNFLELIIHDSHRDMLNTALNNGFSYWENSGKANIPIYRFFG